MYFEINGFISTPSSTWTKFSNRVWWRQHIPPKHKRNLVYHKEQNHRKDNMINKGSANLKTTTNITLYSSICDFGSPPRCKWGLRPSGMLSSVDWWLVTGVLGQPVCPIFKGHAIQDAVRNVGKHQSILRNVPQALRPYHFKVQLQYWNVSLFYFEAVASK